MIATVRRTLMMLVMLVITTVSAFSASVKISVESASHGGSIGVGDMFYIIYTLENVNGKPSSPNDIPGAKLVYFTQSSSMTSMTSINGKVTENSRVEYTATMRATQAGTFNYGPITVGGVRSNAVKIRIGEKSSSAAPSQSSSSQRPTPPSQSGNGGPTFIGKGDNNLFLRASVSKTSAYEQEALLYTVKLYSSYSRIKFVGATAAPTFEGFVVEESKQTDTQLRFEQYQGRTYATAVIARYIIFPQMKGNLKILGNTYTISVDRSEYYHDPYFGNMTVSQPLQLNVTPNDLSISVKPLPEPRPANFSGGVGKFSISSSMPSRNLKTNENASIVYTVSGSGNLKYVQLPDLSMLYPSQIEVFTPQTDVKAAVSGNNVSGSVRFDYSIMPLEEGNFHIPDVELVYFNPETGKYEKSVAKGYDVSVGKGNASAKSQTKRRLVFDDKLMNIGELSKVHTNYIDSLFYWLFYIVPVLLLVIATIVYRKHLKDNADVSSMLSRRANKMAQRRLKKAAACMKNADKEHFYYEILSALWGYLGDKLKMPTSELNRDNVSQMLDNAGLDQSVIDSLISLLDECEFAKYSSNEGNSSMQSVYNSAVEVINKLEESFKKRKNENKI